MRRLIGDSSEFLNLSLSIPQIGFTNIKTIYRGNFAKKIEIHSVVIDGCQSG